MRPRPLRAAVSVLLGVIFLAGLAGEAYGVHDCPHHHRDGPTGPTPRADAGVEVAGGSGQLPLEAPPDGPCTCVGNCHATAVALNAASPPPLPAGHEADLGAPFPAAESRVPRAAAYLLPFANAPPAT